jgi:SecD/SecF fusion protein
MFEFTPLTVGVIIVGLAVLALIASTIVTKTLRMPEQGWRAALIVFLVGLSILIIGANWPPKYGIDLKGGSILVYEVDEEQTRLNAPTDGGAAMQNDGIDMNALVTAISNRINPGGVRETVVRPYGENQVEIVIPDVSDQEVEQIKKKITTGGFLRFLIVANRRNHGHVWSLADDPAQQGKYLITDAQGNVVGQWVRVKKNEDGIYAVDTTGDKTRVVNGVLEVLMYVDPDHPLEGRHLRTIREGFQDLGPCVFFTMTPQGAQYMGAITTTNKPDPTSGFHSRLGIVMDNVLISAPRINTTITDSGVIEGRFTQEEVRVLVDVLRAGRLPAVLRKNPVSQSNVSPLLGEDTIRRGKASIIVSLIAVVAFMLVYYRFAGLVSGIALTLNLLFVLATMIFVDAAFSLAGFAGLVLTVGMSVDANVLIYERMREELGHGASLRQAIRNGFNRAMPTIIDSNLTNLITGLILYGVGGDQLQGYAVPLILGILMCLFTAIFCTRFVFEVAERQRWIRKLTMLQLLSKPNWDLFSYWRPALAGSLIFMTVGLLAMGARGKRIFDIDFAGGNSVRVKLAEAMPIEEVRTRVEDVADDVSVIGIVYEENGQVQRNRIYQIDTSRISSARGITDLNVDQLKEAVQKAFTDSSGKSLLVTRELTFTDPVVAQLPSTGSAADSTSGTSAASSEQPATPTVPEVQPEDFSPDDKSRDDTAPPSPEPDSPKSTPPNGSADPVEPDQPAGDSGDAGAAIRSLNGELLAYGGPLGGDLLLAQASSSSADSSANGSSTQPPQTTEVQVARSTSTLTFDEPIQAELLREIILETAANLNLRQPLVNVSNKDWEEGSSQAFKEWQVTVSGTPEELERILQQMKSRIEGTPVWLSANTVGGAVASDTQESAASAIFLSLLAVIAYVWFRFQRVAYGLAAVLALVHDVLAAICGIAISYYIVRSVPWLASALMIDEFKISLPVMAALLTIIGYSLNDTIVIFDRVREIKGKSREIRADMINDAVNQTLSRTILTVVLTMIAIVILYIMGGPGVHAFAFALIVGCISGTYSTLFIASPALLWFARSRASTTKPEKVAA